MSEKTSFKVSSKGAPASSAAPPVTIDATPPVALDASPPVATPPVATPPVALDATPPVATPPVATPPAPSAEEVIRAEINASTVALATAKAEIQAKIASGDFTIGALVASIATLEAKIADGNVRLTSRTFAPTVAQAIGALIAGGTLKVPSINGRICVQLVFEAGALTSATPFSMDSPRTIGSTQPSVASVARSNLKAATLDERQPASAGFVFRFNRDKEGACEILSLGNGSFRGTRADGVSAEGTLNACVQKLCNGIATDVYAKCNLGEKGVTIWDDAQPAKGWTRVG